ncbi:hypothetical protein [Telmatospirillum siberiense]|uniref:hypothetical protein n=1 Tax=Telmatospirillum siberiense TaxID=382514 RepID=UPI0011AF207E|nr:hypothetical protein [Telmatospirillum siberiense]
MIGGDLPLDVLNHQGTKVTACAAGDFPPVPQASHPDGNESMPAARIHGRGLPDGLGNALVSWCLGGSSIIKWCRAACGTGIKPYKYKLPNKWAIK